MEEEDHLNADQIINNLSTTNMDLEEQIKILKMDVQDLEQLRQMDEEIIEMQKETERELQQKNQELLAAMATMTRQVTDLESRLEGQMNAEEIIAKLTSQNLDLEEQNKELKLDVHELEQLHQMDEEIIDAQKDTERELQLRNEEQMMAMATLKRQLLDWESRAVDYERAIVKFRQKTGDLNETVQQLRDDLATMRAREEEKARAAGAEISLNASANRAFAEVVEAELNSCELQFARQLCVYLRAFLPDNFTKAGGDNDCLVLCVLFPRLSAKALALAQLLQQKFPQPPDGLRREHVTLSHRGEQWAHVRHFGYQLHQLHTTVHKFIAVFKNCSAERLSRLAVQQVEAGQREAKLEEYFKLLQQNRFDENTSIDQLVQIIKYFQRIFSTNLSTEQFNAREDLRNTLVQIREGLGWIKFNGQRLRHYLIADSITSSSSSSGGPNTGGSTSQQASPAEALAVSMHSSLMAKSMTGSLGGAGDAEFCAFLDRLGQLLTECEGMAMRALNRIPEENELILTPELSERLLSAIGALEKCGRIVHQSCSLATSQLSAVDSEGLPAQQMLEFVLSSVEKFVGQVDGQRRAHAHIFESLESIKSALDGLSEALENSSMEIPPPPNQQKCTAAATPSSGGLQQQHQQIGNGGCAGGIAFPPLLDRSHQRKQDAVETEALRWQVSKKDEELLRLQKALKLREQDIGTIKLRLSMAEKQLAENTAGAEIAQLKQNCEQLREEMKSQKEKYELQLDDMQAQLAVSRSECEKEKERTREFSKKALLANMSNRMQQQQQQQQQMASASISSPAPANAADFFPLMTSSPLLPLVTAAGNEGVETTMAAANVANGNVAMTSGGGGGAGDMQRMMGELRSAQERIHLLESQQLSPSLNSYSSTLAAAVGCPKCADRDRSEQQELKELLAESERLVHDSNLLLTPTVQQPIAAWVRHRKAKEQLNFRKESLQIRVHRFWKKYRADQPMPPMFSHLGQ